MMCHDEVLPDAVDHTRIDQQPISSFSPGGDKIRKNIGVQDTFIKLNPVIKGSLPLLPFALKPGALGGHTALSPSHVFDGNLQFVLIHLNHQARQSPTSGRIGAFSKFSPIRFADDHLSR